MGLTSEAPLARCLAILTCLKQHCRSLLWQQNTVRMARETKNKERRATPVVLRAGLLPLAEAFSGTPLSVGLGLAEGEPETMPVTEALP